MKLVWRLNVKFPWIMLLQYDVPMETVMESLGHTDIRTT